MDIVYTLLGLSTTESGFNAVVGHLGQACQSENPPGLLLGIELDCPPRPIRAICLRDREDLSIMRIGVDVDSESVHVDIHRHP